MTIENNSEEFGLDVAAPNRSLRPVLSAIVALVVLAAGAMIGARQLGDTEQAGGAATPEEAVQAIVASLAASDLLGVAEIIDPIERRNFSDPAIDVVEELQRLGLVTADFDLGAIDGLTISFVDMTYAPQPFGDDMSRVSTSGTWFMDGDYTAVPYGPLLTDRADIEELADIVDLRELTDAVAGSHSWSDVEVEFEDLGIVTIQRNGQWFVSLAYSAAEAKRKDEGYPEMPSIGGGPTPTGGATPEEAVANLANAIAARDARQILTSFDPLEAAVAYDYFNLYGEWAQEQVDHYIGEPVSITVDRLDLASEINPDDADKASVFLQDIAFTIQFDEGSYIVDLRADCPVLVSTVRDRHYCLIDQGEIDSFEAETGIDVDGFLQTATLRTRRVGERWFVAAVPSVIESFFDLSSQTEPDEIARWIDDPENLLIPHSSSANGVIAKDTMSAVVVSMGYLVIANLPDDPVADAFEERWESYYELDGSGSPTSTSPTSTSSTTTTSVVPPSTVPPTTVSPTSSTTTTTTSTTTTTAAETLKTFEAVTLTEFAPFGTPATQLKAERVLIEPMNDVELLSSREAAILAEQGWVLTIDMYPGELLQTRFFCDPSAEGCPAQGQ